MNCPIADLTIIGAGPIGLFSVFQAGMLNMTTNIIDSSENVGGQCTALYPEKYIYDIPGHYKITAADLITNLKKQADRFEPKYFLSQTVTDIALKQDVWHTYTSEGNCLLSKKIILAMGGGMLLPRKLPLPNIAEFEDVSIFYSIKNKKNFINKTIVIAGGGNSALDWALDLAPQAKKLYLVHRRMNFSGSPATLAEIETLAKQGIIEIIMPYQISDIHGQDSQLSHITLKHHQENDRILKIDAEMLLLFFGLNRNQSAITNWSIGLKTEQGLVTVNPATQATNVEGIFAIGDISSYPNKIKLMLAGFTEAAAACYAAYTQIHNSTPRVQYSTAKIKSPSDCGSMAD